MKFDYKDKSYYIDGLLGRQLDTLVYNVKDDYDFVIIITGDRSVRVGKSVLAMTVCAYLSEGLKKIGKENEYDIKDIYFDNKEMITAAFEKPPYHINHYDEGREGLAANKAMKTVQQDLLDFFAECGQLNHIFVIVAPDFFKLNEEIAVARSEYLINVYRTEQNKMVDLYKTGEKIPVVKLKRGRFEFFDRKKKQNLYDKSQSTRRKNYGLIKANFIGSFTNQYPVGEDEYRKEKQLALSRFTKKKEEEKKTIVSRKEKIYAAAFDAVADKLDRTDLLNISKELGKGKEYLYDLRRRLNSDKVDEEITKDEKESSKKQDDFAMPQKSTKGIQV